MQEYLWSLEFRPKKIKDVVLPPELKKTFQKFVDDKNIPNLLLTGSSGVGKTTVAKAMLEELGCDYMVINGSLNGNIDTLRTDIQNFASTISFSGGRKYVILDEADYLTNAVQPALRNFMEEFAKNTGFILTCNYAARIIPAIQSRCSVIEFNIPNALKPAMAAEFFTVTRKILSSKNVEYDPNVVAAVIMKYFPDNRRVLNELQRYSALGKIDSGILSIGKDISIDSLIALLKDKDYTGIRKWVVENLDNNIPELFRKIYDSSLEKVKPQYIPALVVLIGKYQYQSAFVADQEINLMSFFAEVLIEGIYG